MIITTALRTGHSFRNAIGTLDEYFGMLKGSSYAPITDRASTYGWVKWFKGSQERKLKPILGVELAVARELDVKRPTVDFWQFFPSNGKNLQPLNNLISLATGQFYYQPLLSYEQAARAKGVIKIIGSRSDLEQIQQHTPQSRTLYAGLSPAVSTGYFKAVNGARIPWLASSSNVYPKEGDLGMYQVICGRNASQQTYPQHLLDAKEWSKAVLGTEAFKQGVLGDTKNVLRTCVTPSLPVAHLPVPEKPLDIRKACVAGAKRLGIKLNGEYKARLDKELRLIKEKEFESYFQIVADITSWSRSRMLVGPARGSSCGSLVCYLLGITTIDPIPHGLIFERFIDTTRNDLPDIDIDFSDQNREQVIQYMADKYGEDHVSRLGTIALYRSRSALAETAAALDIPRWETNPILDSMIERSSGDARAMDTLEDTLKDTPAGKELLEKYPTVAVACRMEGHPRHSSTHASAVVLSDVPLNALAPHDLRNNQIMMDKGDAEDIGLLKVDVLGLTQLSIIEDTLTSIGMSVEELQAKPMDDQRAFDVLNDKFYSGIFQFNGEALQGIISNFRATEFNDIISVTALARPGPLVSGTANEWVHRRNGGKVTYPHKLFQPYMQDTLGLVLYQEQVMEIGRQIGDLDWEQVTALRKAMSKSLGKEFFDQYGDPWKTGARKKGIPEEVTNKVWDDLCAYGSWAFNKSHSVAYAVISYWCLYLKAYHPFEFAAATLNHEADIDKQRQILRELVKEGFEYRAFDRDKSERQWVIDGNVLIGPLSNVKGVGPKIMNSVIGARSRGERLTPAIEKRLEQAQTPLDSLYPIQDGVKAVAPDLRARNIVSEPISIDDVQVVQGDEDVPVMILCTFSKINPRDMNEPVLVAKRGYEIEDVGRRNFLNLRLEDDTGSVFGYVNRFRFSEIAPGVIARGRPGKCLYAVKGKIPANAQMRMVVVDQVRYLGDIEHGTRYM